MQISVCSEAPNFKAAAVMPDGEINEEFQLSDYKGQYVLLFFYPLDFTFVCPSEIIAHNNRLESFKERNTQIIGVSIDSQFSHYAWRNTPVENGGIGPVGFPLVADINHDIVNAFGIPHPDGVALRASFLIDQAGIIQHSTVNNLPLGRNVDEALRLIDALQFTEEHGEVCPAGWQKGDEGMKDTQEGVSEYLSNNSSKL
jgi:peroxiredoxin (alkyl hydroperoxide reductase subunit C)|tara:strand:+ start:177 stop:776 length:600 start_codon:yes stop_codon:yes gene_type:complete